MNEETLMIGDLVTLTERGKEVFKELSDSDMPMRIDDIWGNMFKCLLKGGEEFVYLKGSYIRPFYPRGGWKDVSTREQKFEQLTKQMLETFKKKNADYGNSTTQTFEEFGLTSYAVRLSDKLNRIKTFCRKGKLEVEDESVIDTLLDAANYCLLAVVDIKNQKKK